MQREGKAPMTTTTYDHAEFLSHFGNLSLRNHTGNPSSSTYNVDASGFHRGALPFTAPPPMVSPANNYYRPCNGYMGVPQAPYGIQQQASRIGIRTPMNQLTDIVEQLRRSGSVPKEDIQKLVTVLASDGILLLRYACDKKGSLALQNLIKMIRYSGLCGKLTGALALGFPAVACNGSGRHVIKECFRQLSFAENSVLCGQMIQHFVRLAMDQYGCICLNDCIPLMESGYKVLALATIAYNCSYLARDYYGTHVVQNAITRQDRIYTPQIVLRLRDDIVDLAMQKQGSHLVERCLGMPSTRRIVLEELNKLSQERVLAIACHEFGNFVIQRVFVSTLVEESPDVKLLARKFQQLLKDIQKDLKRHQAGRNVFNMINKWNGIVSV